MHKYLHTAWLTARDKLNQGVLALLPDALLQLVYLIPILMLWQTLTARGIDGGMTLQSLLRYSVVSSALTNVLVIESPLTHWIIEGPLMNISQRPMSIYGHTVAQSLGAALPNLLVFGLPVLLIAPLLGIHTWPDTPWFWLSLALSVSLGFCFEFLFACLIIRMVNTSWVIYSIRDAIMWILSGAFIPFVVLPFNLSALFTLLPFGSLGGAPLSLLVGAAQPLRVIGIQLFWNAVLWPLSLLFFEKSREKLTCQGG